MNAGELAEGQIGGDAVSAGRDGDGVGIGEAAGEGAYLGVAGVMPPAAITTALAAFMGIFRLSTYSGFPAFTVLYYSTFHHVDHIFADVGGKVCGALQVAGNF